MLFLVINFKIFSICDILFWFKCLLEGFRGVLEKLFLRCFIFLFLYFLIIYVVEIMYCIKVINLVLLKDCFFVRDVKLIKNLI